MIRFFGIFLSIVLTSFYIFPFEFTFLPGMNTKMVMAGLSLIVLPYEMARTGDRSFSHWFVNLSIWAALVSLCGLFAVVYNGTRDITYATYIVSMWVWLGAAFFLTNFLRYVHGEISVNLIIRYLAVVCVCQCIIALLIDNNENIKDFVNNLVAGEGYMGINKDRLYGIGASLDVAGIRFSAVVVMIAVVIGRLVRSDKVDFLKLILYFGAFFIIVLVGNMMARTTSIGLAIAILAFFMVQYRNKCLKMNTAHVSIILSLLLIGVVFVVYKYNSDLAFRSNLRFGFEGFFSLVETGKWQVQSNEILGNMIVWPDNTKTWLIGDAYFDNPFNNDPYYIGPNFAGFYKATDIGYLRFIFYFGLIGLVSFIIFMWKAAKACIAKFPTWKIMFWMLLLLNYVIWCKVSTDIFSIFAIFLTMTNVKDNGEIEPVNSQTPVK